MAFRNEADSLYIEATQLTEALFRMLYPVILYCSLLSIFLFRCAIGIIIMVISHASNPAQSFWSLQPSYFHVVCVLIIENQQGTQWAFVDEYWFEICTAVSGQQNYQQTIFKFIKLDDTRNMHGILFNDEDCALDVIRMVINLGARSTFQPSYFHVVCALIIENEQGTQWLLFVDEYWFPVSVTEAGAEAGEQFIFKSVKLHGPRNMIE